MSQSTFLSFWWTHHFSSKNYHTKCGFKHLYTCIYYFIHIFHCFCEARTFGKPKQFLHLSKGMFSQEIFNLFFLYELKFNSQQIHIYIYIYIYMRVCEYSHQKRPRQTAVPVFLFPASGGVSGSVLSCTSISSSGRKLVARVGGDSISSTP